MEQITINKTANPKKKPNTDGLKFGTAFADHMFLMNYETGRGWFDPRVVPYGPISLEPSAMVFHYAQEVFEGMKAYRDPQGKIRLFRPEENSRRLNASGQRLCIPEIPEETFLKALYTLLEVDSGWVPDAPGTSLYVRPFVIATDEQVGVSASDTYIFAIITCTVGAYYPQGFNPVKIMIESEDVRAVRGGTGYTKCGGNYAASLRAGERAASLGYSQVLWLDGIERRYIEEVGSMNVMFKINGKVVTPELAGSVLPGITRKSCIELMKSWGYEVQERQISIDELLKAAEDGSLEEVWGTGTAAVVTPIGEIAYNEKTYTIGDFKIGELTQRLYECLTDIQWGRVEDPYGWSKIVC